jgi:predicted AAA+ superfamily ATPase
VAVRKRARRPQRLLCQVAYTVGSREVRERELRGLPETARHLRADRVVVVTFDDEETLSLSGVRVEVIPAWKWLLEENEAGQ